MYGSHVNTVKICDIFGCMLYNLLFELGSVAFILGHIYLLFFFYESLATYISRGHANYKKRESGWRDIQKVMFILSNVNKTIACSNRTDSFISLTYLYLSRVDIL